MTDLRWVEKIMIVKEGDPALDACEANPGWHLLHVTGGLYTPITFVFGWGDPPLSLVELLAEEDEHKPCAPVECQPWETVEVSVHLNQPHCPICQHGTVGDCLCQRVGDPDA